MKSLGQIFMRRILVGLLSVLSLLGVLSVQANPTFNNDLDPNFYYFYEGEYTGGRLFSVGDPGEWATTITSKSGESRSGKVKVSPISYKGESVALRATFSKRKK